MKRKWKTQLAVSVRKWKRKKQLVLSAFFGNGNGNTSCFQTTVSGTENHPIFIGCDFPFWSIPHGRGKGALETAPLPFPSGIEGKRARGAI
jgi:hypothetical protein